MSKKKKKKQRKKRRVPQKRPSLPAWYDEGIEEWSAEKIFNQLLDYGLEINEETFKQEAIAASEPSQVAEAWTNRVESIAQFGEVFFHLSTISLWKRLLPEHDTFELAMDDLLDCINERNRSFAPSRTEEDAKKLLNILDRFYYFLNKKAVEEKQEVLDIMDRMSEDFRIDVDEFLINLPFELEYDGFIDEAILVARKYAFVDKEGMMVDLGQILANAGRCDDALEQAEQNLKEFPNDHWITIKTGKIYEQCGLLERAEEIFNKVSETADDEYIKNEAYEYLESIYKKTGRTEEALAVKNKMQQVIEEESDCFDPDPVKKPKIGRNEPCHCGSSLKYKKCFLNKS